jgi:hypothetical protein
MAVLAPTLATFTFVTGLSNLKSMDLNVTFVIPYAD